MSHNNYDSNRGQELQDLQGDRTVSKLHGRCCDCWLTRRISIYTTPHQSMSKILPSSTSSEKHRRHRKRTRNTLKSKRTVSPPHTVFPKRTRTRLPRHPAITTNRVTLMKRVIPTIPTATVGNRLLHRLMSGFNDSTLSGNLVSSGPRHVKSSLFRARFSAPITLFRAPYQTQSSHATGPAKARMTRNSTPSATQPRHATRMTSPWVMGTTFDHTCMVVTLSF